MTRQSITDPDPMAGTAKRIGNFATNLLVSGVILIVGIAFGREIIGWWRADSDAPDRLPIAAAVGGHDPIESAGDQLLEFGDFPFVLNRAEFEGDATATLERLRTACRHSIDAATPLSDELGAAEQRMLAAARKLRPVEEVANAWSVYEIRTPLPMVVGVRTFETQVAISEDRVVSWGLAVPEAMTEGEQQFQWTLFTYSSAETADSTTESVTGPAPPGGRRTLSIRTDRGDAVVGYAGTGTAQSWTDFYDILFANLAVETDAGWQLSAGSWRRRFDRDDSETIDVVVRSDNGDTIRSIVITSPHQTPAHQRPH